MRERMPYLIFFMVVMLAAFSAARALSATPLSMEKETKKAVVRQINKKHLPYIYASDKCDKLSAVRYTCTVFLRGTKRYALLQINYSVLITGNVLKWTVVGTV